MKAYPEYKDCNVEWIGKIPANWNLGKVSSHVDLVNGFPFNSDLFRHDNGVPLIRIRDITTGKTETFYSGEYPSESLIDNNDILIGMDGDFLARWWNGGKGVLNQRCCCLRPFDSINKRFLFYILQFPLNIINDLTYFTTVKHLSSGDIKGIKFPLPSLPEQQAIADFLDRKTAQIDTLIEKKQRQIDLLQEQRMALINHAVTKGLSPDVRMKDSGVEWLGEIPSHWKVVKLKYISPNITVGIVITPAKYYVDDGVPCLRSLNVKERKLIAENLVYISPESNELLQKSKIYSGDLVSVRTGQPGTTAVVDERFDGANCIDLIITRQAKEFDSQFLAYQLNSSLSKAQYTTGSSGAIQQHFNVETASNMLVVLPPLDEQIEIRKKLDLAEKRDEDIANNIGLMIQYLQEYRMALISEAVTGKIDVRTAV